MTSSPIGKQNKNRSPCCYFVYQSLNNIIYKKKRKKKSICGPKKLDAIAYCVCSMLINIAGIESLVCFDYIQGQGQLTPPKYY